MGKAMAEFRRVTGGLQAEMRDAMSTIENEVKKPFEEGLNEQSQTPPPAPYVFDPPIVPPNPHLLPPVTATETPAPAPEEPPALADTDDEPAPPPTEA